MGVPYAPRPLSDTNAFAVTTKMRKADVSRKTDAKR
jgi:hypothetical protein